jgi:hypothetical protein
MAVPNETHVRHDLHYQIDNLALRTSHYVLGRYQVATALLGEQQSDSGIHCVGTSHRYTVDQHDVVS